MVPEGWERMPLERVAEIRSGVAKGKKNLKDPIRLPYLRVANVQDGHVVLDDVKEIEIEKSKIDRYSLKKGDVLMNEGGDFDKLGRGDVWLGQIEPCLHQNHVFAVRPNPTIIDSFYLAALAASNYGKTYFLGCAKRSTNLASINSTQLKEFPVLVPPFREQKKIAQILSTWDKAITTTKQLLTNSQRQKKALMQQLLTGKKRLLNENGVRFSGEWEQVKLRDVAECLDNKRVPLNSTTRDNMPGEYPYWGANGIVDHVDDYIFDETIVLLAEDGGNFSEYNSRPIANISYGKSWVNNHAHILKAKTNSTNEWIYYSLVNKNILGFVNGGTRAKLNKSDMLLIPIELPSLKEQKRINIVLSEANREIEILQNKLDALNQEKKALMQQLLTGKRRVKVDEEAA